MGDAVRAARQARTTDLTELDVTRVGLQSVDYRGDVTYPVIIVLDESVPELRWGMTAVAEIETK